MSGISMSNSAAELPEINVAASMNTRSPDHPITGSPDLAPSPGDRGAPQKLDLQQVLQTLNEARRQFLASRRLFLDSKRRYLMVKQFVFVCREIERRRRLEEEERARLPQQEGADTAGRNRDPNQAQAQAQADAAA